MALKSRYDVVPVAIKDSFRIVPKKSLRVLKGTVSLHFGKPLSVEGYEKGDINAFTDRVRKEMLRLMDRKENNER